MKHWNWKQWNGNFYYKGSHFWFLNDPMGSALSAIVFCYWCDHVCPWAHIYTHIFNLVLIVHVLLRWFRCHCSLYGLIFFLKRKLLLWDLFLGSHCHFLYQLSVDSKNVTWLQNKYLQMLLIILVFLEEQ